MSTYTQILYQLVFSTKYRNPTLIEPSRNLLFKYIWGVLKNKKCHLYQIGGVEDHIHIITHVHPSIAVANLIKEIKLASTCFIKQNKLFPVFTGWQNGYAAFTYSIEAKHNLIQYVKRQKLHHKKLPYRDEFKALLLEHGIEFDEKYLS